MLTNAVTSDLAQHGFRALNRIVVPAVKAGLGTPLPLGLGVVVLETKGRVTGEPRPVPLVAARLGDRYAVSTVRANSQWAKNIEADGEVTVWQGGRPRAATARVHQGSPTVASLVLN